jgi:uncharacterized oxidoreductase
MNIGGNTVLITGGATGIGYAFAEYFLEAGNEVIICGRREAKLAEASSKYPELHVRVCDIASDYDRRSLFDWISSGFSNLNVLVNNAGIQREIDFTNGLSEFLRGENEISINLEAQIMLTGLFIPVLKGKKESAIINVTSGLGFIPAARTPVYSAAKAGMHAFTMALRYQLTSSGIKVFEVVPPAVDTELNQEGRAKRGNYKPDIKPKEFVAAVLQALKNDVQEIGYRNTEKLIRASRDELDEIIKQMNSRW